MTRPVRWALAVHGGAGSIPPGRLSPDQVAAYQSALDDALASGSAVLDGGGRAVDAVEVAVRTLEDNPLFNAGRGAAFSAAGRNELDAAIMDGRSRNAGAVAAITRTRNPVTLARAVMDRSPHVLLIGDGADAFAREQALDQATPDHFFTSRRWESLVEWLREARRAVPEPPAHPIPADGLERLAHDEGKRGTVGAVARDRSGDLAAAGSTGGITGKLWGRVGDTALIGAGVYASNSTCAVACTGTGEHFIRLSVAKRISDLVDLAGWDLETACDRVIGGELSALGGEGGVIALGRHGGATWRFNTDGMYRARVMEGDVREISLHATVA